jgi:peptide/nickel transport system ATP-binding protein
VEQADVDTIFYDPYHPYTRALLESIPRIGKKSREKLQAIEGMVPDPYSIPSGCPFHPRCPEASAGKCDREVPPWIEVEPGHRVRCGLYA